MKAVVQRVLRASVRVEGREAASIGYRFAPNWSVLATVEHLSNAGLCDDNRGLTNVGAKLSYHF